MNEMQKARDEQLMAAITVAIVAGFQVWAEGALVSIERTAEGRFMVLALDPGTSLPTHRDDTFDDVRAAVAHFLDLCDLSGST